MKRERVLVAAGVLLALATVNGLVLHKEWLIRTGRPVLLELAPVDPRSLMQGDYMRLNYRVAAEAGPAPHARGTLNLRVDENGVGHFDSAGDQPLRYRRNRWGLTEVGAGAFFFQEGLASAYDKARYGEFRVGPNGESVLIGLRD